MQIKSIATKNQPSLIANDDEQSSVIERVNTSNVSFKKNNPKGQIFIIILLTIFFLAMLITIIYIWNRKNKTNKHKLVSFNSQQIQKKQQSISENTNQTEEDLYELVWSELQTGTHKTGLWAKAIAQSDGDDKKAEALYIRYRIKQLEQETKNEQPVNLTSRKKGIAIASLIFALLQISILAIICGHISINKVKRDPQHYGGKRMAIVGLILGYIGLILHLGVFIMKKIFEADMKDHFIR